MPSARTLLAGGLIGLFLVFSPTLLAQPEVPFDSTGYDEATRMILCDCGCHPQSVHDCACGRAAEMRREIHGLISQGMTGEEVVAHYVEQSGDQIRIVPTAKGFNLLAWIGPLLALVVGSFLMILLIRRWTRSHAVPSVPPLTEEESPSSPDDPYRERLRQALENLE